MSIRKLANHGFQRGGFSLHNILSGNEDVNLGEVGGPLKGNDRLFDFSGRISDASPIDAESPNAQIRLKVPLKLHTSMSQSTTTPTNTLTNTLTNAPSTNRHIITLERQLQDAKQRMQMLTDDRAVRVKKAEEQARKAMSEERTARTQIEHITLVHKRQTEDINAELRRALEDGKQLHDAMTKIDILDADKQSLVEAQAHLTSELEQLQIKNRQLEEECKDSKCDAEKQLTMRTTESSLRQKELELQLESRTKALGIELEIVKRTNSELASQLSTSTENQLKMQTDVNKLEKQAISHQTSSRTNQDLMQIINQLRDELVNENTKLESLKRSHLVELESVRQVTFDARRCHTCECLEQSSMMIASTSPVVASVQCLSGHKRRWRASLTPLAVLDSSVHTIPRLTTHDPLKLGPMLLPLSAGPETHTISKQKSMLDFVMADFRNLIRPTLESKGVALNT